VIPGQASERTWGDGPHVLDDPSKGWLDISSHRWTPRSGLTLEAIDAGDWSEKDKAWFLVCLCANRERRAWEHTHPRSQPFPGVYLHHPQGGK
jgi:hypothetical protein